MKTLFKPLLITAAFILIGAGCTPAGTNTSGDLPTTPPDDAVMESGTMPAGEKMPENGMVGGDAAPDHGDAMMEDDKMKKDDSAMTDDDKMEKDEPAKTTKKPYYIAYTKEVAEQAIAEGRPVVYYFWAAWCPICRAEEPDIIRYVETSEHPIAGFRVNFDTESELKAQYKIPYQHTTVFLNTRGQEVQRFTGPQSEAAFRAAFEQAAK